MVPEGRLSGPGILLGVQVKVGLLAMVQVEMIVVVEVGLGVVAERGQVVEVGVVGETVVFLVGVEGDESVLPEVSH